MESKGKRSRYSLSRLIGKASIVAFDSAPLIYYFEDHPLFAPLLEEIFEAIEKGSPLGVISAMTFHEILVKPKRENNISLITTYQGELLDQSNFTVSPVTTKIAELGADLRTKYPALKSPDALIVATALVTGADVLITGDKRLEKILELPIIALTPTTIRPR